MGESDKLTIEILLYSMAFRTNKAADQFCLHWTTDVVHGRFVYQDQEFIVPELPTTHCFVADISENFEKETKLEFPVRVQILVAKKGDV